MYLNLFVGVISRLLIQEQEVMFNQEEANGIMAADMCTNNPCDNDGNEHLLLLVNIFFVSLSS